MAYLGLPSHAILPLLLRLSLFPGDLLIVITFINAIVLVFHRIAFGPDIFADVGKDDQFIVQAVTLFHPAFYGNIPVGYFILLNIEGGFKILIGVDDAAQYIFME